MPQVMPSQTFDQLTNLLANYNGAFDRSVSRLNVNGVSFERDSSGVADFSDDEIDAAIAKFEGILEGARNSNQAAEIALQKAFTAL